MLRSFEVHDDRRGNLRWSVNRFLQANGTISSGPGDDKGKWSGMLVNISHNGAQVIMPGNCADKFHVDQNVNLYLVVRLEDIRIDISSQIKSIIPGQCYGTVRISLQFVDLEKDQPAMDAVKRTCQLAQKYQIPDMIVKDKLIQQ